VPKAGAPSNKPALDFMDELAAQQRK
jgi:hypothetical protein